MRKLIKSDFQSRIVLFTLSVVLISGFFIGAAVLWNFDSVGQATLRNRVQIESDLISQNIAASVLFDDATTAAEILSTFRADPAILSVDLKQKDGSVFVSYKNSLYDSRERNVFILTETVHFDGKVVGTLSILVSKNEVYEQNIASAVFILIVLVVTFLLVAALAKKIIRTMMVPLLNLHEVSERIATTRDYSLRVAINSEDEVGRLSNTFNQMVEQIEHRDVMLEKKVRQRTVELEKLAEEFRFRAFHDSLTGLPNRALLHERFLHSIDAANRRKCRFACLLLDLDDFKTINDTKGHELGDELLIEVAARLKATVRAEDLVCRLGGDEFVVLLNDLHHIGDANVIANKILSQLNKVFSLKSEYIHTAVSIGGAVYPDHGGNLSEIKRHADVAMYRAKEEGKNRFCLFSEGMQEDVKYRLMIQNDLRPALDNRQLEIYLQPKVDAKAQQVVGCEALVRWNHPVEGFLTPNKFIPFAEEMGMIADIDYFVVRECCALIVRWSKELGHPLPIAFNLSGRHFHDDAIVHVLRDAITSHKIDPSFLEMEITEAVLIQDPEKAQKIVLAIKNLGIKISLDDFGTGYSSLNYLRTLPIDTVKLDRSFVSNIDTNHQDRRLTRSIVSLAENLGLSLVAEGVETESQMNALLSLGCRTMQGYYFLPPATNQNFLQWYSGNFNAQALNRSH